MGWGGTIGSLQTILWVLLGAMTRLLAMESRLLQLIALVLIQAFDAFIHLANGIVEPLRLGASVMIVVIVLSGLLAKPKIGVILTGLGGAVYLVANMAYVVVSGWPGPLFWVLVVGSLTVSGWLFAQQVRAAR